MHLAAVLPYLIIGVGLALGQAGLRPAMRIWGICMIGALCGLIIGTTIAAAGQESSWYLAAISVLPFAIILIMVIKDLSYPPINDIATDIEKPIMFGAALCAAENAGRNMAFPENFKAKIRKAYPHIQPLKLNEPADRVFDRVLYCAKRQRGWRVIHHDPARKTVEAEAVTPFLGFVDDVVVQVSEEYGMSCVNMRSKSREGLVDAGKNAKRIEGFLQNLRQSGGQPGRSNKRCGDTKRPIDTKKVELT